MGRKARLKELRKTETQEGGPESAAAVASSRRKLLLIGIPIVTLALVALFWFVFHSRLGVGVTSLVGAVGWLALIAHDTGSGLKPNSRDGASRIDFGGRR